VQPGGWGTSTPTRSAAPLSSVLPNQISNPAQSSRPPPSSAASDRRYREYVEGIIDWNGGESELALKRKREDEESELEGNRLHLSEGEGCVEVEKAGAEKGGVAGNESGNVSVGVVERTSGDIMQVDDMRGGEALGLDKEGDGEVRVSPHVGSSRGGKEKGDITAPAGSLAEKKIKRARANTVGGRLGSKSESNADAKGEASEETDERRPTRFSSRIRHSTTRR
jgi:hypothetical protein